MTLTVTRTSPTQLVLTRRFAALSSRLWAAHTEPDLIRRWLLGPDGWTMTRCDMDGRPGGSFRYDWSEEATGTSFHIAGPMVVFDPPHRMVHIERMYMPDPTPENRVETRFDPDGSGTLMTIKMDVDDPATMGAMIATGMTDGMEASYARVDPLVA